VPHAVAGIALAAYVALLGAKSLDHRLFARACWQLEGVVDSALHERIVEAKQAADSGTESVAGKRVLYRDAILFTRLRAVVANVLLALKRRAIVVDIALLADLSPRIRVPLPVNFPAA
jgi:hypothetical protein